MSSYSRVTKSMFSPEDLQGEKNKKFITSRIKKAGIKSVCTRKIFRVSGLSSFTCSSRKFTHQIALMGHFQIPLKAIFFSLGSKRIKPVKSKRLKYFRMKAGRPIRGQRTHSNGRTPQKLNKKR